MAEDSRQKIEREAGMVNFHPGKEGFYVSTDKKRLQISRIKQLMEQTFWARERSLEQCQKAMDNSRCYGLFDQNDYQVGYARVLTDYTTTFYLADVIVDERYRGKGLVQQCISLRATSTCSLRQSHTCVR